MNIHTPRVDPLRLASATIQAVDRIGAAAAEEIDETADEMMRGAAEIAGKLRELAEAIRGHSKIAHEQVMVFCDKAASMLDGIRNLQGRLESAEQEHGIRKNHDDIPAFLKQGPADFDDSQALVKAGIKL